MKTMLNLLRHLVEERPWNKIAFVRCKQSKCTDCHSDNLLNYSATNKKGIDIIYTLFKHMHIIITLVVPIIAKFIYSIILKTT